MCAEPCGVVQAFVNVFGDYAGWAHNALFISQLASHKHLLEGKGGAGAKDGAAASGSGASSESEMTADARAVATGANLSATPSSKSKKQKQAAGKAQDPPAKLRRLRGELA